MKIVPFCNSLFFLCHFLLLFLWLWFCNLDFYGFRFHFIFLRFYLFLFHFFLSFLLCFILCHVTSSALLPSSSLLLYLELRGKPSALSARILQVCGLSCCE